MINPKLKFLTRFLVAAVSLALLANASSAAVDEVFLTPVQEGAHQAEVKDLGNGEWEIRTTGDDPYFMANVNGGKAIDLKKQPTLAFDYFSTTGVGLLQVFVGPPIDGSHVVNMPDTGVSEGWTQRSVDLTTAAEAPTGPVKALRIDLGARPGIVVRLRSLRARPATEQELRLSRGRTERAQADIDHTARLLAYLDKNFPNQITSVTADDRQIKIEGKLGMFPAGLQLAEVPMWEDITNLKNPETLQNIPAGGNGKFLVTIGREAMGGRDRLLSAWAVVRKAGDHYEPLSAMHYVDSEKSRADLPPAAPKSRKGLGGFLPTSFVSDVDDLGISAVTVNLLLNGIMRPEAGPGRTAFQYGGRTWYVDDAQVASYDHTMKVAAEHGIMVSAIVLVAQAGNAPEGTWNRDVAHPDADPTGIFVMPNFTTKAGVEAYAAAMNFVAERYSRPDGEFGRIHHWILHNEINCGFVWTNAGVKNVVTYLDLYQKSMRVAFLIARQYDPHAKPFISLEHHWTKKLDSNNYAARELLELLVKFSRKEGDFPWAIAFHPYPQDLFNARTWEDPETDFDFQTPYLTYRNLEVLDAWARQPSVAFQGKEPREVHLTEQGLNSRDYSDVSLAEQAAGMAYVWKKMEPLKTITAFQYHNWVDNRGEGGLRIGLRKFPDDPTDPLGKKPIWFLYQSIGTDQWDKASSFALPIIGIKDWSEIQHTGEIK